MVQPLKITGKMKKIIFLLLVTASCKAQVVHTGIPGGVRFNSFTKPDSLKYIFIDSMKSLSLIRHGNLAAGVWAYSDSGLTITPNGTGTDGFDAYGSNPYNTNLENFEITQPFTALGDSAGIGVAMIGYLGGGISCYVGRVVLSGVNKGQLRYDVITGYNTTKTLANSGTNYFNFIKGRGYTLSLKRTPDSIITRLTDTLSGSTMSISLQPRYDSVVYFLGQRQSQVSLMWYGGKIRVYNLKYYSTVPKKPNMLFIGDSNMQGELAGSSSNRFAQQVSDYFKGTYAIDAGASNKSSDIKALLPEILLINPKSIFLEIGTNDTDSAIYKQNMDSIVTVLTTAGIKVYLGTIFPVIGSVSPLNSTIRSMPNVTVIDFDTELKNGYIGLCPCYNSVSVHLNAAGNTVVANKIILSLNGYLIAK